MLAVLDMKMIEKVELMLYLLGGFALLHLVHLKYEVVLLDLEDDKGNGDVFIAVLALVTTIFLLEICFLYFPIFLLQFRAKIFTLEENDNLA